VFVAVVPHDSGDTQAIITGKINVLRKHFVSFRRQNIIVTTIIIVNKS
jgi:hypothetical protein